MPKLIRETQRLEEQLDPSRFYDLAQDILGAVDKEERISWYNHPMTQALRYSLNGDLIGIFAMWIEGAYAVEESTDGTAQRQAKARAMAQSISDVLEYIEDLKRGEEVE